MTLNDIITLFEIFTIGFGFGIAGPCFISCAPILFAYAAGASGGFKVALKDVACLLSGRVLAYCFLGFLAGASGVYLKKFTTPDVLMASRYISAFLIITLSIFIIFGKDATNKFCGAVKKYSVNIKGLFLLGFIIGIAPCAPLLALLFQIVLVSKNPLHGMLYGAAFGLGTFLSGLLIIGPSAGMLTLISSKVLKDEKIKNIFRILCGLVLLLFGVFSLFKTVYVGSY